MFSNPQRQFDLLKKLGFVRICGTPEELKAAHIIMDEIRSIGFEPVLEPFYENRCFPVEAKFTVTQPVEQEFPVRGYFYCDPVNVVDQEYDFYYLEDLDPISLKLAKGKFVLTNLMQMNAEIYGKLFRAGIRGIMTMDGTVRDHREETDLHTGRFRAYTRNNGLLPGLKIRMIDALELIKLQPEKVRISVRSEEKTITSHNVTVTVPGTEYPDEYIGVGAHYDSVEFSSGVWDNAAGVVTIMELLRYFREHPPKRTVKFCFFGAEEIGLKGSRAFLEAHPEDQEKYIFMFNADVGANVLGSNVLMTTAQESFDGYVSGKAYAHGFPCKVVQEVMSSDSAVFNDYGIPSLCFMRDAPMGAGYMHTRFDMISLLAPHALTPITEFLIAIADEMVNSVIFPVERVIPQKHQDTIVARYGFETCVTAKKRENSKH